MESPLDLHSVRVLGSLIEKASTTPDSYPLTLNALTAACNQTSNRDPVLQLDESTVAEALDDLSRRQLVRGALRSDSRVPRYRHLLAETLNLHPPEIAVLAVLMLRGPQMVGEIRTRTARLFEFPDVARVELTLQSLASLSQPLVVQLPRQPGQKELRYAHLLSGEPQVEASNAVTRSDTGEGSRIDILERQVAKLLTELADLRSQFDEFRRSFQ
jgi:uncharacterized protein YceH (UPF0502 family)